MMNPALLATLTNHRKADRWTSFRPKSTDLVSRGASMRQRDDDAWSVLQYCDGSHTIFEIAAKVSEQAEPSQSALAAVSRTVRDSIRAGAIESIEESVYRETIAHWRTLPNRPVISKFCTGDYFTAVEMSDGAQGAAINFNNVSGPHKTAFNYRHFDALVEQVLSNDPVLERTFLQWTGLDPLAKSLKVAVLNALSGAFVTADAGLQRGLRIQDGYLDLVARLQEGDTVAMIGCTGNYSCPEVGRATFIKRVLFSDFEYTGQFKAGIERCIERFFERPEIVEFSDGTINEKICGEADVVIIIADTLCTNTLDELIGWSANAREVLVTGRSYAMNPYHAFARGVTGLTMQRIVVPSLVDFVHQKLARAEFGFTDSLVECFQRVLVTECEDNR